jgi:hypothetical protein
MPNIILNKTERHGVAVTLSALIRACCIRILSGALIMMAVGFRDLPQLLQANAGMEPRLDYGTFLSNYEFTSRRAIRRSIFSETDGGGK